MLALTQKEQKSEGNDGDSKIKLLGIPRIILRSGCDWDKFIFISCPKNLFFNIFGKKIFNKNPFIPRVDAWKIGNLDPSLM